MNKKLLNNSKTIRKSFLDYFHEQGHEIVPSSSLIPSNDPTLLFTNAGMVQFKDVFLGKEQRPYQRAVSSQRCLRAGGKHNDLERVGYTARHHTFFEMLGNFSFGDYFKDEAIPLAWNFIIHQLKLPPERLWITVYKDDKEAEDIWLNKIKINPQQFSRCDEDNFWSMGPTGPCGPCTEIFYDHGPGVFGGPPGSKDADGDRYVEIWNLVFMQYDRAEDGTLTLLPKPSVDTGMGLERITAIQQGVCNNYDTDLFLPLIKTGAKLAKLKDQTHFSLRVIADHIRACSFLIVDGIIPSNEGRGYVLRRILRRALRHGNKLGIPSPFFYKLVNPLIDIMGDAYPELMRASQHIEQILRQEEEQFNTTLSQGLKLFEQAVSSLKGEILPGELVFKLYDTYGFPADLTADIARERGILIDLAGFETEMNQQRERSRQSNPFKSEQRVIQIEHPPTEFIGHKNVLADSTPDYVKVLAIYQNGIFQDSLTAGQKASLILDRSPFYAESGGQVGDQGVLSTKTALFKVHDTIKHGPAHLHLGKLEKGSIFVGDELAARVDPERRAATVLNHTATHLLHLALRQTLGETAIQKGSLVEPERLRFDFSHSAPLSKDELQVIEQKVNEHIRANHEALVEIKTPEEAVAAGAIALFGEKYGKQVRVVHFGQSVELCGGTHAEHTGEIGLFKITNESGVAAGIRRIEAVTGKAALSYIDKQLDEMQRKQQQIEARALSLEKENQALKSKLAGVYAEDLLKYRKKVGDIVLLCARVEGLDGKALRNAIDYLKEKLGRAIIVLASVKGQKVGIVAGVTPNLVNDFKANEILRDLTQQLNGKAGGRADLAEGGGEQSRRIGSSIGRGGRMDQEKIS